MVRYRMSLANAVVWSAERLPFTMSSRAASLAQEIGLNCATDFSQSGNESMGKNVLLVKVSGNVRKLTIATRESMLRTLNASDVKMKDSPSPSNVNARKTPRKSRTLKVLESLRPLGRTRATMNVRIPMGERLRKVLSHSREIDCSSRDRSRKKSTKISQLPVEYQIDSAESHVEDKYDADHSRGQVCDVGRCTGEGQLENRVPYLAGG